MLTNRHTGLRAAIAMAATMAMNAAGAAGAVVLGAEAPKPPRLSFRESKRKDRRELHARLAGRRRHTNRPYVAHAPSTRDGSGGPLCRPDAAPLPARPRPGFPHVLALPGESVMCNRCQVEMARIERAGGRAGRA